MTFRIETAARGRFTVFLLSGGIEKQAIAELSRLFEGQTDYRDIVLDLKDVCMIDREAMLFVCELRSGGREDRELRSLYSRMDEKRKRVRTGSDRRGSSALVARPESRWVDSVIS
jgi:hypothetical protein